MVVAAAGAALLMMPWVLTGCTPRADGTETGYSTPGTMVLVGPDDRTLTVGWIGCAQYAALQATERRGSVMLRMYWRRNRAFQCSDLATSIAALTLDYQVRLAAPLASRRLTGPDGVALPWLAQAQLLRFGAGRAALPDPVLEPLFPDAKCLGTQSHSPWPRLRVVQCAYPGAAATSALGPPSGTALAGTPARVRGRAGHLVEHEPDEPPWTGYDYSWHALWWIEDNRIVVLTSQHILPGDHTPLSASQLVVAAGELRAEARPAAG